MRNRLSKTPATVEVPDKIIRLRRERSSRKKKPRSPPTTIPKPPKAICQSLERAPCLCKQSGCRQILFNIDDAVCSRFIPHVTAEFVFDELGTRSMTKHNKPPKEFTFLLNCRFPTYLFVGASIFWPFLCRQSHRARLSLSLN